MAEKSTGKNITFVSMTVLLLQNSFSSLRQYMEWSSSLYYVFHLMRWWRWNDKNEYKWKMIFSITIAKFITLVSNTFSLSLALSHFNRISFFSAYLEIPLKRTKYFSIINWIISSEFCVQQIVSFVCIVKSRQNYFYNKKLSTEMSLSWPSIK